MPIKLSALVNEKYKRNYFYLDTKLIKETPIEKQFTPGYLRMEVDFRHQKEVERDIIFAALLLGNGDHEPDLSWFLFPLY